MNNAPQVENLADVLARLNPATQAQEQIIQKQQAGLGAKYGAQKTGLEAAKVKGFNTINTGANARGMAFSGIPIDEQATYLAEKYLPGLQNIDVQQNEEDLALQGQLATIGADKFNKAFSTVEGQKSDLNSWNQMQAQLEATARENALNRAADAARYTQENIENRPPTLDEDIADSFSDLAELDKEWLNNGSTERMIQSLSSRHGVSPEVIAAKVYPWRKQFEKGNGRNTSTSYDVEGNVIF